MFMCNACGELYTNCFDECPKAGCNGGIGIDDGIVDIVPVDDAFAPVIQMFQKKGYEVDYAEFGHAVNTITGSPMIVFKDFLFDYYDFEDFKNEIFKDIPSPWVFKVIDGSPALWAMILGSDRMEKYHNFLIAHSALATWIEDAEELTY